MKLQRLLGILAVLLQRERVSAHQLAQRFEVSVRTIYRDLETLEQAGVPIFTQSGPNGGIEILDTYKLDKTVFLSDDFAALLTGLQSISGAYDSAKISQTSAKLRQLIPAPQAEHVELSGRQIHIDLKPWSIHPHFEALFSLLREGISQQRLVSFDYTAREQSTCRRIAEPHQLVLKEQKWYLRGYCREREDFRTFHLRRMEMPLLEEDRFTIRPFSVELDDFKDWSHPKTIVVELLVEPTLNTVMMEHCKQEHITVLPDGMLHVKLPFVESEYGYGILLQMGHRARVLSPEFVRLELIDRIERMQSLYLNS